MATSLFTDCSSSSMQGSTTSSSTSDLLTLTTAASSWCAIPSSTRIRLIRLLRPHSRRILVSPGAVPSYGLAVRGGKEYSTGFFVSNVERNSEAEQKGLRIGDQILRVNGYKVDDAIHKEFVQLVSHQERLTLKVRGVGMLPVKDKDNDCLTWNVVKNPSISSNNSECSYQSSERTERNHSRNNHGERVINVVLNVAPRIKLGLGICKGPEWKPGIFVQFTKEKSVAREAGLRPGDQILTVNSIDFSDVLFSEAVAVMKSSNKLDMTVHTGAGCDLFPGESSGYNSSASSVTGDQSPCWADVKAKRLTSVSEESSTHSSAANWHQNLYANDRKCRSKSITERSLNSNLLAANNSATNLNVRQISFNQDAGNKEINKTIIKLSENGATSINNTFVASDMPSSNTGTIKKSIQTLPKDNVAETAATDGTLTKFKQTANKTTNILPPPPPMAMLKHSHQQQQHHHRHHHHHHHHDLHHHNNQQQSDNNNQLKFSGDSLMTSTTNSTASSTTAISNSYAKRLGLADDDEDVGNIKIGGVAATMQRYQYANLQLTKLNKAAADNSTYSNIDLNMESEKSPSCYNDGGSLSSAITEELKKRKARRQPTTSLKEHAPHNEMKPLQCDTIKHENNNNNHHHHHNDHHHHHSRAKTSPTITNVSYSSHTLSGNEYQHKNENNNNSIKNNNNNTLNVVDDQHSALMNEFKQAHKRMFKNGFKECGSGGGGGDGDGASIESMENGVKDRKEALLNTAIMEDAGTYRSKKPQSSSSQEINGGNNESKQTTKSQIPNPPPLQMDYSNNTNTYKNRKSNGNLQASSATNNNNKMLQINDQISDQRLANGSQNTNRNNYNITDSFRGSDKAPCPSSNVTNTNRQTLRLGSVTIGEYRQQTLRREPEKFDFIAAQKKMRDSGDTTPTNESLQSELQNTLSRANLRKSHSNSYTEHQRNCPLHQHQQQQLQQHQMVDSNGNGNGNYAVEEVSKKLQKSSLNENNSAELLAKANNRSINYSNGTMGVGILKNGHRHGSSSSHSNKSTEKSIKFG